MKYSDPDGEYSYIGIDQRSFIADEKYISNLTAIFNNNMEILLDNNALSVRDAERKCNLSRGQISKRLNGHQQISLALLIHISKGFGVTIDTLISKGGIIEKKI
jgi:transcriptional regulator with XRE-family HTH domain